MPASYPAALKTFSVNTDDVTLVNAAYADQRDDEIEAIQTELGTDPAGSMTDLKTRLAVVLNDNGTLKSGVVLTTPVLGVATATSINKVAITAPATSATLTIADGK